MFKQNLQTLHGEGAREANGRGDDRRDRRVGRADARDAQVGEDARGAHARVGRRPPGQPARPLARAASSSEATASPSSPELTIAGHPEVFAVGDVAAITDAKTEQRASAARLGRAAVRRARRRDHREARRGQGDEAVQVHGQGHDGDDRPRRGGRADARRQDDEGQARPSSRGGRCTSRSCPRTRTARRRRRLGGRGSDVTSAPAGSRVTADRDGGG